MHNEGQREITNKPHFHNITLRLHCRSDQLGQTRSRDRGVVGVVGFLHDYFGHVEKSGVETEKSSTSTIREFERPG